MKYQTVVDMALEAYTLNECLAAETAIQRWLSSHPEDLGLYEIAGQLGIVKAAALEREVVSSGRSAPAKNRELAATN